VLVEDITDQLESEKEEEDIDPAEACPYVVV
jgi:hypothetical protein